MGRFSYEKLHKKKSAIPTKKSTLRSPAKKNTLDSCLDLVGTLKLNENQKILKKALLGSKLKLTTQKVKIPSAFRKLKMAHDARVVGWVLGPLQSFLTP